MRIDVRIPGDELREALRSFIERELRARLKRQAGRVRRASVQLSEFYGDQPGAVSTLCRIAVELEGSPEPVVTEALAENPYRAADEAVAALERAVYGSTELVAA